MKNGHFVISLDFELHWGFFDLMSVDQYQENLANVGKVIDGLLELSALYDVKITFATVGFLFAKDKKELLAFTPKIKPTYTKEALNPYPLLNNIGTNEIDDPYHFGYSILEKIKRDGHHEISTHTFSHYYCNEAGQSTSQFNSDIAAAKNIGEHFGTPIKSIVFPRNMVNDEALKVCKDAGITSYRGTEKAYIYRIDPKKPYYNWLAVRGPRMLDSYINITGNNIYDLTELNKGATIINLPSSRFLRPYNSKLSMFESLKIKRITKGMKKAAQQNKLFHLWWHPHNFGSHMDKNFENLEKIFNTYKELNNLHGFSSVTMTSLANKLL